MNALAIIFLVAFQLPQVWQPKPQVLVPPKQSAALAIPQPTSPVVSNLRAEAPSVHAAAPSDTYRQVVIGAVEGPFSFKDSLTVKIPIQHAAHSGLSLCRGKGCHCPCGHDVTPEEATLCICLNCGCDCEHAVGASKLVPPAPAKVAPAAVAAPVPTRQAVIPPLAGPQYGQPAYYYTQPAPTYTYQYGVAGDCANGQCGTATAPHVHRRGLFGIFRGRW